MKLPTKRKLWSWRKVQASLALVALLVTQWQGSIELAYAQLQANYTDLVAILVDENLLRDGGLKSDIYRYADDVQGTLNAQALVVPLPVDTSPKEIYEGLSEWYTSGYNYDDTTRLSGVVLVGDFPLPVVNKNGRHWPTIFPYVDFEAPAYVWDDLEDEFVFKRTRHMQAEVWHGLIRGTSETESVRREQLRQYFDHNHKVHTGEKTFDKKVLQAHLTSQKNSVPALLLDRYQAWLDNAEDIQYLRFSKDLVSELKVDDALMSDSLNPFAQMSEGDQNQLINQLAASSNDLDVNTVTESINSDGTAEIPDIYSKYLIDQLTQRYQEIYKNWISQINGAVTKAGRWDGAEVDTLPSLVSTRDEAAVLFLRAFNDQLESQLIEMLNTANLANRPWVEENTEVSYWDDDGFGGRNYTEVTRPNYWNGVARDANFSVEDCTLNRGNAPQIEANRTFDPVTVGSCVTSSATQTDIDADQYEGCCATNLDYDGGTFSYTRCDTSSSWSADEGIASVVHQGAELPVFAIEGTARATSVVHGAAGCLPIIETTNVDEADSHRFSSLMLHQEPTAETITAQLAAQTTNSLPIDSPRGFSFLDHGLSPQRVDFPNLFDLRTQGLDSVSATETAFSTLLSDKVDAINDIITAANTASNVARTAFQAGCGGTYTESAYDANTTRADCDGQIRFFETASTLDASDLNINIDSTQLYGAATWLDQTIDQKNKAILELTLEDSATWNTALLDTAFKGYEFSTIVGEGSADALALSFSPDNSETDEEFLAAQREVLLTGIASEIRPVVEYEGVDFADTFLNQEELSDCETVGEGPLGWAEKLECHLKNTPTGGTLNLFVPELGQKNKTRKNTIVDSSNRLVDKVLRITPDKVLIHNQGVEPVPVTVVVTNKQNQIQKDLAVDSVSLRFSSPTVEQFFDVFPSVSVPVTNGRAEFWLVPKTKEYGGKFALIAEARQGDTVIRSSKVPLIVPRYRLQLTSDTPQVNVKDPAGIRLNVRGLDANSELSDELLGKKFAIEVQGGTIEGGDDFEITDLTTPITFFPGTQAGEATIRVYDPAGEVAGDALTIQLQPDVPAAVKLTSDTRYAFVNGPQVSVEAAVTDAYGNVIEDLLHEYSWNADNADMADFSARDETPRRGGLQEVVRRGKSELSLIPTRGDLRVEVVSDKLPKAGRSFKWTTVKNPQLIVSINEDEAVAGQGELSLVVIAADRKGGRLTQDFAGQIQISHLGLQSALTFKNGEARFQFDPGTRAGDFTGQVLLPGFPTTEFGFTVLPGEANRIILSGKPNYDTTDRVEITLSTQDQYGNQVPLGGSVLLKATQDTNHLIDPIGLVNLDTGATRIELSPTGLTGTLNLIVRKDGLLPGTLSLNLANRLTTKDLAQLSPQGLLSLWLGFESNDVANTVLHAGGIQAVGALMSDPRPGKMQGLITNGGSVVGDIDVRLVSGQIPVFHFYDGRDFLTSAYLNFGTKVEGFLNKEKNTAGIYVESTPRYSDQVTFDNQILYYESVPILQINTEGGVSTLNENIELLSTSELTHWNLYYQGKKLATLDFYAPGAVITSTEEWITSQAGVQLKNPHEANLSWQQIAAGWELIDDNQVEVLSRRLGMAGTSVEDASSVETGWVGDWKPGTLLAAGNNIGESTRIGASDIFILYGDPTLSLDMSGNQGDIGRAVWTAPNNQIDDLLHGNFLAPDQPGVLVATENHFRLLLPQDAQNKNWHDWGELLRVQGNILQSAVLEDTSTDDLAILDTDGLVSVYDLSTGNWTRTQTSLKNIQWIGAGKFNQDGQTDLAFVDEKLNLGVVMKTGNSFTAPQFLGSLAPNFSPITESSNDDAVTYLGSTFIGYANIEDEPSLAQKLQRINVAVQTTTPIDLENLAEDLTAEYKNEGTGIGNKKSFVSLPLDPSMTSSFSLRSTGNQLQPGDTLTAQLRFVSDTTREGVEVMLPKDAQLSIDKSSLSCTGCASTPRFYRQNGFGDAWVYLDRVSARTNVTLTWEYIADDLVIKDTVSVGDRDNDGIDDLIISRFDKIIQYLSRDQKYDGELVVPALDAPETAVNYIGVPTVIEVDHTSDLDSYERMSTALEPLLADPDVMAAEFATTLAADEDGDGVPDNFDHYPGTDNNFGDGGVLGGLARMVQDFSNKKQDLLCGYGDCFNFPVSKVLGGLAPGLASIYIPPITIPRGLNRGKPVLSWPTTQPGTPPTPTVYPASAIGRYSEPSPFMSQGRLYLMPTTTGHLGIALCTNDYKLHIVPPAWTPNCLVVTPKIDFLGVCQEEGDTEDDDSFLAAAGTTFLARSSSAIQIDPQRNFGVSPGQFTAQLDYQASQRDNVSIDLGGDEPVNLHIPGFDLVSAWLDAQMDEFSNFGAKLPTLQMKFKDRSAEDAPDTGNLEARDQIKAQLSKYEVKIESRSLTLPYPNISGPDLTAFMEQFKNWKLNLELSALFDLSLPDLSAMIDDLKKLVADLKDLSIKLDLDLAVDLKLEIDKYLSDLKAALAQLKADYDKFCFNNPEPNLEDCDVALNLITDFSNLEKSLTDWKQALSNLNIAGLQSDIGAFAGEVTQLIASLENLKDLRVNAEKLIASAEGNLETLESYKAIPEALAELPEKSKEMLAMAADGLSYMDKFMNAYFEDLDIRVGEWEQAFDSIKAGFKVFDNVVLNVLLNFNNNCRTCVADRGTMLGWLLKIVVGAIDLPVFKLPQFPDIVLDFTGLDLGFTIVVPGEINFKPFNLQLFSLPDLSNLTDLNISESLAVVANVEAPDLSTLSQDFTNIEKQLNLAKTLTQNLPETPSIPEFSADGAFVVNANFVFPRIPAPNLPNLSLPLPNLPTIPAINVILPELPKLPEVPNLDINVEVPNIALPNLPTIPPAPSISLSFVDSIAALVEIPFAFLDLFCLLRLGVAPVPEWYVQPYVEQLTNRTELSFGLDFGVLSIKDFDLGRDAIELAVGLSFAQVFDPVSKIVDSIGAASQQLINDQSQDAYRGEETPNIPANLQSSLPHQWQEVRDWAEKTRTVHAQNAGKTVSVDEFWAYFRERLSQTDPKSTAQQKLKYDLLALEKPVAEPSNLAAIFETKIETAQDRVADSDQRLVADLDLLDELSQTPWSEWAAVPALQARERFLATTEREYQTYEAETLDDLTTDTVGATLETDGTVSPILPNLLGLEPADTGLEPAPEIPVTTAAPSPGIYYVTPETSTVERLTEYIPLGKSTLLITDMNGDGSDEIWWTEEGTLYLKDRQETYAPESNENTVITVDTQAFLRAYTPGVSPVAGSFGSTQTLKFDDISTDLNYWEWILSDHYDIRQDIQKRPASRLARNWQRFAYTDELALSESGIEIDYIAGDPSISVGKGQTATVGDKIYTNFKVELDNDDQVELILPDGSGVSLLAGESYHLTPIERGDTATKLKRQVDMSGFGVLVGIRNNKRSHLTGPFYHLTDTQ